MKYFICDDNILFAEDLARRIAGIDNSANLGVYSTLAALLFHLEEGERADAVFLDIVNADGNGLSAAERIRRIDPSIRIVLSRAMRRIILRRYSTAPSGASLRRFSRSLSTTSIFAPRYQS